MTISIVVFIIVSPILAFIFIAQLLELLRIIYCTILGLIIWPFQTINNHRRFNRKHPKKTFLPVKAPYLYRNEENELCWKLKAFSEDINKFYDSYVTTILKNWEAVDLNEFIDVESLEPLADSVFFKDKNHIYILNDSNSYSPMMEIINIDPAKATLLSKEYITDGTSVYWCFALLNTNAADFKVLNSKSESFGMDNCSIFMANSKLSFEYFQELAFTELDSKTYKELEKKYFQYESTR